MSKSDQPLCSCCEWHPSERQGGKIVTCPDCGEPCTCEGCIADADEAEQRKLDAEREASMEGGE